ncbi:hypothetical protein JCM10450v2_003831 [Rhodotorula kratochvilovae]
MPSRKKAAPAAVDPVHDEDGGIEAFELQKSVVARLVKGALPADVKLQKEVPLAMVKGSTVFIAYLAALAHDTATEKNHKTIAASHVLEASKQLAWDDGGALQKMLKKELAAFRAANEAKKQGRGAPKAPKSAKAAAAAAAAAAPAAGPSNGAEAPAAEPEAEGMEGVTLLRDDGPNADAAAEGEGGEADADEEGIELYEDEDGGDEEMDDAGSEGLDEPEVADRAVDDDEAEYRDA